MDIKVSADAYLRKESSRDGFVHYLVLRGLYFNAGKEEKEIFPGYLHQFGERKMKEEVAIFISEERYDALVKELGDTPESIEGKLETKIKQEA